MGKITSFSQSGTYCKLIEYDDIEGFVLNTELDRRVKDPKKQFKCDQIYPFYVLFSENGTIDLSYKKVNKISRKNMLDNYNIISKICKIVDEMSFLTNIDVKTLYPLTVHKLFQNEEPDEEPDEEPNEESDGDDEETNDEEKENEIIYGTSNAQKLFNSILQYPELLTQFMPPEYNDEVKLFRENFTKRINVTNIVISQSFNLTILCENAIEKLREVLKYENNGMKVNYISSPIYQLLISCEEHPHYDDKIKQFDEHISNCLKDIDFVFTLTDKTIVHDKEYHIKFLSNPEGKNKDED